MTGRPRTAAPAVGERVGKWTVVGEPFKRQETWHVSIKCECGYERPAQMSHLRTRVASSTGPCDGFHGQAGTKPVVEAKPRQPRRTAPPRLRVEKPDPFEIPIGSRFGKLTTTSPRVPGTIGRDAVIDVRCDCGVEISARSVKVLRADALKGRESACEGCVKRRAEQRVPWTTHGATGTRLFKVWRGVKARTTYPSASGWARYGGRGITLCEEWQDFTVFRQWAEEHGYVDDGLPLGPHTLTIERKDPDGDYEPSNCEWITHAENGRRARLYQRAAQADVEAVAS